MEIGGNNSANNETAWWLFISGLEMETAHFGSSNDERIALMVLIYVLFFYRLFACLIDNLLRKGSMRLGNFFVLLF